MEKVKRKVNSEIVEKEKQERERKCDLHNDGRMKLETWKRMR